MMSGAWLAKLPFNGTLALATSVQVALPMATGARATEPVSGRSRVVATNKLLSAGFLDPYSATRRDSKGRPVVTGVAVNGLSVTCM